MPDVSTDGEKKLHDIFMDGWNLHEELEKTSLPSNGPEYKNKVQSAMEHLEQATKVVSDIGLFSPNEVLDEVTTESLQYLLLPFFLGKLTLKLNTRERSTILEVAEIYFKDYLQRCQEYELCKYPQDTPSNTGNDDTTGTNNELTELMRAAHARNDKIVQFRRKKELEEQIKIMRDAVRNQTIDDEAKREFFINYIKKGIIESNEELQSIKMEKQMLEMRKLHTAKSSTEASVQGKDPTDINSLKQQHGHEKHSHGKPPPKPLQPFIITKSDAQKAVFGMGYPSLPVMTVDDFYKQRVQEGIFPDEEKVARMNQAQAIAAAQDPNEKEDAERAIVEMEEETDNPEYLARARGKDEYKDSVRRGDGNRYNRS